MRSVVASAHGFSGLASVFWGAAARVATAARTAEMTETGDANQPARRERWVRVTR
jgi:hypothetical protein